MTAPFTHLLVPKEAEGEERRDGDSSGSNCLLIPDGLRVGKRVKSGASKKTCAFSKCTGALKGGTKRSFNEKEKKTN